MKIRNIVAAAAAITLAASPAVVQANVERTAAPIEGESELGGSSLILAALAAAAVIGGLFIVLDDEEEAVSA